jgi:hypothetical protein
MYHCVYWVGGFVDEFIRSKASTSASRRWDLITASRDTISNVPVSSCMFSDSPGAITTGRIGAYNAGAWLVNVVSPLSVGYSCIPSVVTKHCSVFLRNPGPCNRMDSVVHFCCFLHLKNTCWGVIKLSTKLDPWRSNVTGGVTVVNCLLQAARILSSFRYKLKGQVFCSMLYTGWLDWQT